MTGSFWETLESLSKGFSELGAGSPSVQADIQMAFDPLSGSGRGRVEWWFARASPFTESERSIALVCHHYAHVLTITEGWMTRDVHEHVQYLAEGIGFDPELAISDDPGHGLDLVFPPFSQVITLDSWDMTSDVEREFITYSVKLCALPTGTALPLLGPSQVQLQQGTQNSPAFALRLEAMALPQWSYGRLPFQPASFRGPGCGHIVAGFFSAACSRWGIYLLRWAHLVSLWSG